MSIHVEQIAEVSGGFSKEIDQGAKELMFSTLQRYQYMYPIKSTIRETVSNGLDSIREKQVALSILKGQSKVEDHYIQLEGSVYKDSRFSAEYYDPQWMSDKDYVEVIYTDGGELGKDSVMIRDWGVGLGGSRLEGFFSLGYSSKRLSRFPLGKFGLGAKSPLSTGVPFYTIVSRYNGMEYMFNIYSHKVESIIPRYDLEAMVENPSHTFSNGYTFYSRRTGEKNGLDVIIATKKHHKQQYLDAVTNQLLYFNNIQLKVVSGSSVQEIPVKAEVMYEDDLIVLANNSSYSKPHLLLNGVNYGYIDFRELELEEKLGNIGIKVDPEKVSVNPSRESLIWDEVTRQVVVDKFHEVVSMAEETINRELKEEDFLRWLKICATTSEKVLWEENNILSRLSKVVDLSRVELSYPLNKKFKFTPGLLNGIKVSVVTMTTKHTGSKTSRKIEYGTFWRRELAKGMPIILQKGDSMSNRQNKYMLTHIYPQGFILIKLESVPETEGDLVKPEDITTQIRIDKAVYTTFKMTEAEKIEQYHKAKEKIATLHNFILGSTGKVWYESIEVPADFKANENIEEEQEDKLSSVGAEESAEQRRKIEGLTVVHTPILVGTSDKGWDYETFKMQKVEMPPHVVDSWSNEEIFWSNQDFEPLLCMAAFITRLHNDMSTATASHIVSYEDWKSVGYKSVTRWEFERCYYFIDTAPVRLFKVSQQNTKYYKDFKHITRFFKEIKQGVITMSNALIRWNTARLIQEKIGKLRFLDNFESIDAKRAGQYQNLIGYITVNWRSFDISSRIGTADRDQLVAHLDNVGQFQLFVREHGEDKEAVAQLAQQMFNPQPGVEITDGLAIDTDVYDSLQELLDWAEPVYILMNMIQPITGALDEDGKTLGWQRKLTNEEEDEIRSYFKYRNCPV